MPPPSVLMLSDVYFPRVNGVSTSIQTFRRDLDLQGCKSVLVAPRYPEAHADEPGVERVRSRYFPFDPEDRILVANEFARASERLARDCDVVHIHTPFVAHATGVRLARRLGLPVIETYHTYFEAYFQHYVPLVPRGVLRAVARAISRRQCNAVDAVVAPSPQMAEILRNYGIEREIRVIPTGLDLARLSGGDGARFRARHGIAPDRPVALTVSRVAFEKNIGFLIDVLERVRREMPAVLLVIAGEGPALPAFRRMVDERGLANHVCFVGYLDRAGPLQDCYRAANTFVFASRTETQGLVLLEAMAAGLPVVSTAVLGTRSVLEGAQGAIVVPEDAAQFAAALQMVLGKPELQASLGAKAAQHVQAQWSSAVMARRLLDLYQRVRIPTAIRASTGRLLPRPTD